MIVIPTDYTTEGGTFYTSREIQKIMDIMDCDQRRARHICELMDSCGSPDWSEASNADLRDHFEFCLSAEKHYAEQD